MGLQTFAHGCPQGVDLLVQQGLLDRHEQVIGEHTEEDVGFDPRLDLVEDRSLGERGLHSAERVFDARQQGVDAPHFVVTEIAAIGLEDGIGVEAFGLGALLRIGFTLQAFGFGVVVDAQGAGAARYGPRSRFLSRNSSP